MKTKDYLLMPTILVLGLLAASSAEPAAKLSFNRESLNGIKDMAVLIHVSDQVQKAGLKEDNVQKNVTIQLEQAGFKIVHSYPWPSGNPNLHIIIKSCKIYNKEIFAHNIEVRFRQVVTLERNPRIKVNATTWQIGSLSYAGSEKQLVEKIQENLRLLVDDFITEHSKANPRDADSVDANEINSVQPTIMEEGTKLAGKKAIIQLQYVASKNSQVFHKPDCRWAQNISPQNLECYQNKEEAIRAGKRPCRSCKP